MIKQIQAWLPFIAGLGLFPKVILSLVILLVTILLLTVIWKPEQIQKSETRKRGEKTNAIKSMGPIEWKFSGYLGMSGRQEKGNMVLRIRSFQLHGINKTQDPITIVEGYVRNNQTGDKYPLKLNKHGNVVGFDELVAVPPNQPIGILAFFGDIGQINDYSAWKG